MRGNTGRKPSMTFWSRHEPVNMPRGNTDHWSKMRIKATAISDNAFNAPSYGPVLTDSAVEAFYQDAQRGLERNQINDIIKTKSSVGDFSKKFVSGMNGRVPGNYHLSRPKVGSARGSYRNIYSDRAKEGFVYWYRDRPKPTQFGRYGIGSYKTVLGIGNAPRT
ncbi:uncharacterized protein LOC135490832 isoform X2 [Lineus longissimus]|uniref:uncharacterized protein LOC135490832 isoform X2 n=1 Tax=Lineus longissimus TaxID=88925 RepID=UPI002B4ED792